MRLNLALEASLTSSLALALALALGCASMVASEAENNERRLAQAGFQKRNAQDDNQASHLESLPQRKLVKISFGEEERYVYADADYCDCIYTGDEAEFRLYYKLLRADINKAYLSSSLAPTPPDEAPVSAGLWGAWGP